MLSVLHVCRTYFPDTSGGIQESIRQISHSAIPYGIKSKIFTLSPNPNPAEIELSEGLVCRARSFAAPFSCDLGGLDAFRKFERLAQEADIVHYHFPWPFADLLDLIVRKKAPSIMTYHSDIVRQNLLKIAYAPIMRQMIRGMQAVVATTEAYAESSSILSNANFRDRLRIIPLGIDESTYPNKADDRILLSMGLNESPFFLFIGVPRYYKGLHTLIEVARYVDAPIVIAGNGPELANLRGQASLLGVDNVKFCGYVSDTEKIALLKKCTALVLPSHLRSEAFGMTLVESSMFGKPMVTCEIGTGTSFVNMNRETGFVVPPESPQDLAYALNALLQDGVLCERFGRAARHRYEALFSGPVLGKAYAELYKEILSNNRPATIR